LPAPTFFALWTTPAGMKVSELEKHLRIRLLLRGSRKLTLTDAGRDLRAYIDHVRSRSDAASDKTATYRARARKQG
jgi:DNA-binding transcriptional LysR family regulator